MYASELTRVLGLGARCIEESNDRHNPYSARYFACRRTRKLDLILQPASSNLRFQDFMGNSVGMTHSPEEISLNMQALGLTRFIERSKKGTH
jgi:hypothetical protein